jgi:16S rRNA (cytosine1402-N4)-methyltransferase
MKDISDSQVPAVPSRPIGTRALHEPVMVSEVLAHLTHETGLYVDTTVGLGGHSEALLTAQPKIRLLGIDRDADSLKLAAKRLKPFGKRVTLKQGNFADLERLTDEPPVAILMDLGISSWQLAERGFSFTVDAPLDFRMDRSHGVTAEQLLKASSEKELADLLYQYGEEYRSRRIAKAVIEAMRQAPIDTTQRLAKVIEGSVGRRGRIHPATKSFQALRIAVNDELGNLKRGLEATERLLQPGGNLAVITFHSIEDRIVKQYVKN